MPRPQSIRCSTQFGNFLGFGLIELMISLSVGAMIVMLVAQGYGMITRWVKREADKNNAAMTSKEITQLLQSRLGSGKAFQNLSFYVPNSGNPGFQSIGPGIFVLPNRGMAGGVPATGAAVPAVTDTQGNSYVQSILYMASKKDANPAQILQLGLNQLTNSTLLVGDLVRARGSGLVAGVAAAMTTFLQNQAILHDNTKFAVNDFVAFSNVQTTDIASIKTAPGTTLKAIYDWLLLQPGGPHLPSGLIFPADLYVFDINFPFPLAPRTYLSPTFLYNDSLATINRMATYLQGDSMFRAEITAFGIDPATHELVSRTLSGNGNSTIIAKNVKSFNVTYSLKPGAAAFCTNPLLDATKNSQWDIINADPKCYQVLDAIHLKILLLPPPGASSDLELGGEMDFSVN